MADMIPINFYTGTFGAFLPQNMQPCQTAQARILGEDGNRYAVIQIDLGGGNSHYPVIYCYDTNTVLFFGASEGFAPSVAKMQADLTTLALPGAPTASNFQWINETFGVSDTQYFVVMGLFEPGDLSGDYLAFIRYKLNASSAIELVDGFIVRCAATFFGHYHEINLKGILNQSTLVDCRIIDSTLYIAGSGQSTVAGISDTILLAFPLTTFGTCNTTVGSYTPFVTVLFHGPNYLWPFAPGYGNGQRGCIVSISGNVGLLAYAGAGSITNSSWGNPFFSGGAQYNGKPRLIFSADSLTFTDYGTTFGIPFADTLFNFAGSLTTNINNDYNGPSLVSFGGKSYVIFTRIYNDNIFNTRFQMFSWPSAGKILDWTGTYFDGTTFPHVPISFAAVNMFFNPAGDGHLILQSDVLNWPSAPNAGVWRLYADFGKPNLGGHIFADGGIW